MEDFKISLNYAKALILLATETQTMDDVYADMRLVNQVCKENRVLSKVMNNPAIKESQKVAVVTELFKEHISDTSLTFLQFVVKKRRAVNLKGISAEFLNLYRKHNGIVLAEYVSAVETDPNLLEEVKEMVADFTQKDVEMISKVNNKRIGGFYLTFDNMLYDDRCMTKLKKLRVAFSKNEYESKLGI